MSVQKNAMPTSFTGYFSIEIEVATVGIVSAVVSGLFFSPITGGVIGSFISNSTNNYLRGRQTTHLKKKLSKLYDTIEDCSIIMAISSYMIAIGYIMIPKDCHNQDKSNPCHLYGGIASAAGFLSTWKIYKTFLKV